MGTTMNGINDTTLYKTLSWHSSEREEMKEWMNECMHVVVVAFLTYNADNKVGNNFAHCSNFLVLLKGRMKCFEE